MVIRVDNQTPGVRPGESEVLPAATPEVQEETPTRTGFAARSTDVLEQVSAPRQARIDAAPAPLATPPTNEDLGAAALALEQASEALLRDPLNEALRTTYDNALNTTETLAQRLGQRSRAPTDLLRAARRDFESRVHQAEARVISAEVLTANEPLRTLVSQLQGESPRAQGSVASYLHANHITADDLRELMRLSQDGPVNLARVPGRVGEIFRGFNQRGERGLMICVQALYRVQLGALQRRTNVVANLLEQARAASPADAARTGQLEALAQQTQAQQSALERTLRATPDQAARIREAYPSALIDSAASKRREAAGLHAPQSNDTSPAAVALRARIHGLLAAADQAESRALTLIQTRETRLATQEQTLSAAGPSHARELRSVRAQLRRTALRMGTELIRIAEPQVQTIERNAAATRAQAGQTGHPFVPVLPTPPAELPITPSILTSARPGESRDPITSRFGGAQYHLQIASDASPESARDTEIMNAQRRAVLLETRVTQTRLRLRGHPELADARTATHLPPRPPPLPGAGPATSVEAPLRVTPGDAEDFITLRDQSNEALSLASNEIEVYGERLGVDLRRTANETPQAYALRVANAVNPPHGTPRLRPRDLHAFMGAIGDRQNLQWRRNAENTYFQRMRQQPVAIQGEVDARINRAISAWQNHNVNAQNLALARAQLETFNARWRTGELDHWDRSRQSSMGSDVAISQNAANQSWAERQAALGALGINPDSFQTDPDARRLLGYGSTQAADDNLNTGMTPDNVERFRRMRRAEGGSPVIAHSRGAIENAWNDAMALAPVFDSNLHPDGSRSILSGYAASDADDASLRELWHRNPPRTDAERYGRVQQFRSSLAYNRAAATDVAWANDQTTAIDRVELVRDAQTGATRTVHHNDGLSLGRRIANSEHALTLDPPHGEIIGPANPRGLPAFSIGAPSMGFDEVNNARDIAAGQCAGPNNQHARFEAMQQLSNDAINYANAMESRMASDDERNGGMPRSPRLATLATSVELMNGTAELGIPQDAQAAYSVLLTAEDTIGTHFAPPRNLTGRSDLVSIEIGNGETVTSDTLRRDLALTGTRAHDTLTHDPRTLNADGSVAEVNGELAHRFRTFVEGEAGGLSTVDTASATLVQQQLTRWRSDDARVATMMAARRDELLLMHDAVYAQNMRIQLRREETLDSNFGHFLPLTLIRYGATHTVRAWNVGAMNDDQAWMLWNNTNFEFGNRRQAFAAWDTFVAANPPGSVGFYRAMAQIRAVNQDNTQPADLARLSDELNHTVGRARILFSRGDNSDPVLHNWAQGGVSFGVTTRELETGRFYGQQFMYEARVGQSWLHGMEEREQAEAFPAPWALNLLGAVGDYFVGGWIVRGLSSAYTFARGGAEAIEIANQGRGVMASLSRGTALVRSTAAGRFALNVSEVGATIALQRGLGYVGTRLGGREFGAVLGDIGGMLVMPTQVRIAGIGPTGATGTVLSRLNPLSRANWNLGALFTEHGHGLALFAWQQFQDQVLLPNLIANEHTREWVSIGLNMFIPAGVGVHTERRTATEQAHALAQATPEGSVRTRVEQALAVELARVGADPTQMGAAQAREHLRRLQESLGAIGGLDPQTIADIVGQRARGWVMANATPPTLRPSQEHAQPGDLDQVSAFAARVDGMLEAIGASTEARTQARYEASMRAVLTDIPALTFAERPDQSWVDQRVSLVEARLRNRAGLNANEAHLQAVIHVRGELLELRSRLGTSQLAHQSDLIGLVEGLQRAEVTRSMVTRLAPGLSPGNARYDAVHREAAALSDPNITPPQAAAALHALGTLAEVAPALIDAAALGQIRQSTIQALVLRIAQRPVGVPPGTATPEQLRAYRQQLSDAFPAQSATQQPRTAAEQRQARLANELNQARSLAIESALRQLALAHVEPLPYSEGHPPTRAQVDHFLSAIREALVRAEVEPSRARREAAAILLSALAQMHVSPGDRPALARLMNVASRELRSQVLQPHLEHLEGQVLTNGEQRFQVRRNDQGQIELVPLHGADRTPIRPSAASMISLELLPENPHVQLGQNGRVSIDAPPPTTLTSDLAAHQTQMASALRVLASLPPLGATVTAESATLRATQIEFALRQQLRLPRDEALLLGRRLARHELVGLLPPELILNLLPPAHDLVLTAAPGTRFRSRTNEIYEVQSVDGVKSLVRVGRDLLVTERAEIYLLDSEISQLGLQPITGSPSRSSELPRQSGFVHVDPSGTFTEIVGDSLEPYRDPVTRALPMSGEVTVTVRENGATAQRRVRFEEIGELRLSPEERLARQFSREGGLEERRAAGVMRLGGRELVVLRVGDRGELDLSGDWRLNVHGSSVVVVDAETVARFERMRAQLSEGDQNALTTLLGGEQLGPDGSVERAASPEAQLLIMRVFSSRGQISDVHEFLSLLRQVRPPVLTPSRLLEVATADGLAQYFTNSCMLTSRQYMRAQSSPLAALRMVLGGPGPLLAEQLRGLDRHREGVYARDPRSRPGRRSPDAILNREVGNPSDTSGSSHPLFGADGQPLTHYREVMTQGSVDGMNLVAVAQEMNSDGPDGPRAWLNDPALEYTWIRQEGRWAQQEDAGRAQVENALFAHIETNGVPPEGILVRVIVAFAGGHAVVVTRVENRSPPGAPRDPAQTFYTVRDPATGVSFVTTGAAWTHGSDGMVRGIDSFLLGAHHAGALDVPMLAQAFDEVGSGMQVVVELPSGGRAQRILRERTVVNGVDSYVVHDPISNTTQTIPAESLAAQVRSVDRRAQTASAPMTEAAAYVPRTAEASTGAAPNAGPPPSASEGVVIAEDGRVAITQASVDTGTRGVAPRAPTPPPETVSIDAVPRHLYRDNVLVHLTQALTQLYAEGRTFTPPLRFTLTNTGEVTIPAAFTQPGAPSLTIAQITERIRRQVYGDQIVPEPQSAQQLRAALATTAFAVFSPEQRAALDVALSAANPSARLTIHHDRGRVWIIERRDAPPGWEWNVRGLERDGSGVGPPSFERWAPVSVRSSDGPLQYVAPSAARQFLASAEGQRAFRRDQIAELERFLASLPAGAQVRIARTVLAGDPLIGVSVRTNGVTRDQIVIRDIVAITQVQPAEHAAFDALPTLALGTSPFATVEQARAFLADPVRSGDVSPAQRRDLLSWLDALPATSEVRLAMANGAVAYSRRHSPTGPIDRVWFTPARASTVNDVTTRDDAYPVTSAGHNHTRGAPGREIAYTEVFNERGERVAVRLGGEEFRDLPEATAPVEPTPTGLSANDQASFSEVASGHQALMAGLAGHMTVSDVSAVLRDLTDNQVVNPTEGRFYDHLGEHVQARNQLRDYQQVLTAAQGENPTRALLALINNPNVVPSVKAMARTLQGALQRGPLSAAMLERLGAWQTRVTEIQRQMNVLWPSARILEPARASGLIPSNTDFPPGATAGPFEGDLRLLGVSNLQWARIEYNTARVALSQARSPEALARGIRDYLTSVAGTPPPANLQWVIWSTTALLLNEAATRTANASTPDIAARPAEARRLLADWYHRSGVIPDMGAFVQRTLRESNVDPAEAESRAFAMLESWTDQTQRTPTAPLQPYTNVMLEGAALGRFGAEPLASTELARRLTLLSSAEHTALRSQLDQATSAQARVELLTRATAVNLAALYTSVGGSVRERPTPAPTTGRVTTRPAGPLITAEQFAARMAVHADALATFLPTLANLPDNARTLTLEALYTARDAEEVRTIIAMTPRMQGL